MNLSIPFIINEQIVTAYPALRIGVVVARGIKNAYANQGLTARFRKAEQKFIERYTLDDLNVHPHILAWREAYRSFGVNPKDHRPTAESLLRRILRGDKTPTINLAVNCYLITELEHLLPVGGYDLARVEDYVELRFSPGGEPFVPLGGNVTETTREKEVVYADKSKVLTRRWNYRDGDQAKITEESSEIALFCEAASDIIPADVVTNATEATARCLGEFCGGTIRYFVADTREANSWDL